MVELGLSTIKALITEMGFPIACCIIMFFQQFKLIKTLEVMSTAMTQLTNDVKALRAEVDIEGGK